MNRPRNRTMYTDTILTLLSVFIRCTLLSTLLKLEENVMFVYNVDIPKLLFGEHLACSLFWSELNESTM